VVVEDLDSGERITVAEDALHGRYIPTGHILYSDPRGTLMAVRFDARRMEVTGAPFPVETGIRVGYGMGPVLYAVSEAGTLAFLRGTDYERQRLVWVDRDGQEIDQIGPSITLESHRFSPDGQRIAAFVAKWGHSAIYTIELESGQQQRITLGEGVQDNPIWSPDGRQIAYHSMKSGAEHHIEVQTLGSSDPPHVIYSATRAWIYPISWSSQGWVAFRQAHPERGMDLYAVRVDSSDQVLAVAATRFNESGASFSPDGRWLRYTSNESGRNEVYVVAFPDLTPKQQITSGGGADFRWSPGSDELYFRSGGVLQRTKLSTEGGVSRWSPPELAEEIDLAAPGEERRLSRLPNPESPSKEIHVITNWFEVLREKEQSG
jgi:Tol biopolymer transport system component